MRFGLSLDHCFLTKLQAMESRSGLGRAGVSQGSGRRDRQGLQGNGTTQRQRASPGEAGVGRREESA